MKRENQKTKNKKSEPKKPAPKQPAAAEGSASQGTAGTVRRWVETLDRLSRSKAPLGIAIVPSPT